MKSNGKTVHGALAAFIWLGAAPSVTAATDTPFAVDSAGQCIWPRSFASVPVESRPRVQRFWDQVVERHRVAQRQINAGMIAAMREQHLYDRAGLTDEQKAERERIGAEGRARLRDDQAVYQQEYDDLIASLPEANRIPAGRALAVLVMPVDKNCPHGFQMDPLKLHSDPRLAL